MGALKVGNSCIIIQGNDFGKKIKINRLEKNEIYFEDKGKEKKVNVLHVFPIEWKIKNKID